jgi:hypothetical protein
MVQIYNEITIYFYKEIFASGASPSNPCLPPDPPAGGIGPLDPVEGVPPLYSPPHGRVYIILGCKYFMGYKHDWK